MLTYWPSLAAAASEWSHSAASLPVAAIAVFHPSAGRTVVGKIHFRPAGDSLVIRLEIGGFVPKQRYRLRLHEYDDCSADKAQNTGEPIEDPADLIEFLADEDGWVEIAFSHRGDTLGRGLDSLLGR
jgi:flavin-dependent dehydrogenase